MKNHRVNGVALVGTMKNHQVNGAALGVSCFRNGPKNQKPKSVTNEKRTPLDGNTHKAKLEHA